MKLLHLLALAMAASAQEPTAAQRNDACYAVRGQRSPDAIAAMRKAIDDPVVRACAARNLREAAAAEALIDALTTGTPDTRIAAARELAELHDPRALDPLGRAALDPNPLVAAAAIAALAAYPDRAALPYLLKAAEAATVPGVTALELAARFGDPAVLPIARQVLDRGDAASQVLALGVIADLGDASDLPKLRALAENSEPLSSRGRGFGFMPPIDLGRVARNVMEQIAKRAVTH